MHASIWLALQLEYIGSAIVSADVRRARLAFAPARRRRLLRSGSACGSGARGSGPCSVPG